MKKPILFVISCVILIFYIGTWGYLTLGIANPKMLSGLDMSGFIFTATTVAGVSSALVLGVLGATKPGSPLTMQSLSARDIPAVDLDKATRYLTVAFLLVWVVIGALSVIYGVLLEAPAAADASGSLTDLEKKVEKAHKAVQNFGMTWVGMAVSCAMVLFGVNK